MLRGNLWSRAPANRPARKPGVAPGRRRGKQRRHAVSLDPIAGRVVGAGYRRAGGALRHRPLDDVGRRAESLGLPGDGQAVGRRRCFSVLVEGLSRNSRGSCRTVAGRRDARRCPRTRPAAPAWPGCCSGRAARSTPPATGGGTRRRGKPRRSVDRLGRPRSGRLRARHGSTSIMPRFAGTVHGQMS